MKTGIHHEARLAALGAFYSHRLACAPAGEVANLTARLAALKAAANLPPCQLPLLLHLARNAADVAALPKLLARLSAPHPIPGPPLFVLGDDVAGNPSIA